jgi:sigma-B regulation protein RsbU (phosphoserine phosphatase)
MRNRMVRAGWNPRSRLQGLAMISMTVSVIMWLLQRLFPALRQSASWQVAYSTMDLLTAATFLLIFYRWLTRNLMWRLRNRLVVTYIFIGVIPLVLLATIFLLAGYIFAGQFATFVVTNDLKHELRRLETANTVLANSLGQAVRHDPEALERLKAFKVAGLDGRQVVAYRGGKAWVLESSDDGVEAVPTSIENRSALVQEQSGKLYLRASASVPITSEQDKLTVLSSLRLDPQRLAQIASEMGVVTLMSRQKGGVQPDQSGHPPQADSAEVMMRAGKLGPGSNLLDVPLSYFGTSLPIVMHETGQPGEIWLQVQTRPSVLYGRLFRTLGDLTDVMSLVLVVVCIIFALIELFALIIGVRLTRTMTASVARLYEATQRVNRGDFAHRIAVTRCDQLAALEVSFNSMTENLPKLIAEQKEKQRIESELAIAQEVQALLFPRDVSGTEGLEIHGVCKPARTVSGDYYDFLPMASNTMGLAVGDISGKGISAALMMATVHAFVRAYTLVEPVPAIASAAVATTTHTQTLQAIRDGSLTAGTLLSMLNQQLYQSTPTEKYATMFLGFYNQETRHFQYSNAGHLPPILVRADGKVQQLSEGGTVVGLFGSMTYPDAQIQMRPGDILVAYSDGITEPENEFGEFGVERLTELVQLNRDESLARIADIIIGNVLDWIGGKEQPDDCTVVLARAV